MATIEFMPDRLNAEPVVFRGFTTPELGLTVLFSLAGGRVGGGDPCDAVSGLDSVSDSGTADAAGHRNFWWPADGAV